MIPPWPLQQILQKIIGSVVFVLSCKQKNKQTNAAKNITSSEEVIYLACNLDVIKLKYNSQ